MEQDYAAQLNEARAQEMMNTQERRQAQEEEVARAMGKPMKKQNVLPSLVGIVLLATGIEFVPFGDLLPSFIGAVIATGIRLKKAGRSINPVGFAFMGMLAAVADFSDWLIIGSIPLVGDIFDGMMGMFLGFWSWWQSHSS